MGQEKGVRGGGRNRCSLEVVFGKASEEIIDADDMVVLDRPDVLDLVQQMHERHSHFFVRVVNQLCHALWV